MSRARRLLFFGGILLAGLAAGAGADAAEPQFPVTPYLWIAGVTGTLGTVEYRLNESITLRAGDRWLSFARDDGPLRQEMGLGGPLLGATIRF